MARVMIVDDARLSRTMLADILASAGHEVVYEASDGNEALDHYPRVRPDVVTLDITMPGKNGLDVLRELLASDPHARVVMCSALGEEPKIIEALEAGARDFVVKPVSSERLAAAVQSALL